MRNLSPHPIQVAVTAVLAFAPIGQAAALPACPIPNGQSIAYDIMRSGNVIGHQTTHYAVSGSNLTVTVDVNAALSALGIRVYHYAHHGQEQWRDGQLVSLVTTTDDDGTPRHVNASRDAQGAWHGVVGAQPGPGPLLSTSFWNIQTVTQTRLLDRETGEIVPVQVSPAAAETIQRGTRSVAASRYDLAGPVKGSVWYDANGCWVQALFHTRVDGSLVEVRAR